MSKFSDHLEKELAKYVTIDRFSPIEKLVWGVTWLIITAVVVAGLSLVIKK